MSFAQLHPRLLARLLPKSLPLWLIAAVLLVSTPWASAADPLGATPHNDGTTTFRVWAPFVDAVAVKINGGTAVTLAREAGHCCSAITASMDCGSTIRLIYARSVQDAQQITKERNYFETSTLPTATPTVLNHHRLTPALGQAVCQEPRADIGTGAGTERQDEMHRPLRPRLSMNSGTASTIADGGVPKKAARKSIRFRFTRWVRHDRPRSDDIRC
jgi:hypothetical protein